MVKGVLGGKCRPLHRRLRRRSPSPFRGGFWALLLLAFFAAPAVADPYAPRDLSGVKHPDWARSAILYQLNTRQFTAEGTLAAAEKQLPRLKALGVDIIWLMPVQPIGVKNRKGTLGSPYSVRDYYQVNPELGTMADLKAFVRTAHRLGLHVILDWVANHSAWDNPLVASHPEYYERDWKGNFRPTPWWDWSDIIDFDYRQAGLRRYMGAAMLYWVKEADVDGFRADVAAYVPRDFWEDVRTELDRVKPVFMLAEAQMRDLHDRAFDASYAWGWYEAVENIAQGKADVGALFGYYSENESAWPAGAMRMTYVENHDQNAWHGTQFEIFGKALANATVLSVVGEGIPLLYNGVEAGNPKRLAFFERDPIAWRPHPQGDLYKRLFALKHRNPALWNAPWGARMVGVANSAPSKVFSFVRQKGRARVFAAMNFSGEAQAVTFKDRLADGAYRDFEGGGAATIDESTRLVLPPWSYRLFTAE
ncbi:MAG: alpha-amylase [Alphaproteobacteria bacterium]|nr:alpha-amylase [Alphaproteobacteria bacterium]MBV9370134.1 alpha-amylase [Alphaproteobacteria bacterium]MBV9901474.1 alpha-amylase [Alphaproteobacteria bacterium]